jgi:O-phosphoseryl-tRNA(Sec) kinase
LAVSSLLVVTMNQFLLVLCGLPASGKTTLARALLEQSTRLMDTRLVCTDQWRDAEYYAEFAPEKENKVRELALARTKEYLASGASVIHDDSNYYASMRHELHEAAVEAACRFGIVHITTPLKVALEWNLHREGSVPKYVIERISERFDAPGKKYAWDAATWNYNPTEDILERAVKDILHELEGLAPVARLQTSPLVTPMEEIDSRSRRVVASFLAEHHKLRDDEDVSRIRREVLKLVKRGKVDRDEMEKVLERCLCKLAEKRE